MPTKMNSAGQQQPYVPAGYGDASGEYADSKYGSNRNYTSPNDTSKQLPYTQKTEQPDINEIKKQLNGGKEIEIPKEKKSKDYTYKFAENVEISRGSLNDEEIGVLNQYLDDIFDNYPEMQKFKKILVRNNTKSSTGGYIKTYVNYFSGEKAYELYINSGWLDFRDGKEKLRADKQFFINKLKELEESNSYNAQDKEFYRKSYKENIEYYDKLINDETPSNVINRIKDRKERLKSLLSHEIMHRITQSFYEIDKSKVNFQRWRDIASDISSSFEEALFNDDIKSISKYAQTSREEFLSEANAMIEGGFEVPDYIRNTIENIKKFLRSEQ